jgi:serine/threonine-protein phosphatase 2B catalytic subunit
MKDPLVIVGDLHGQFYDFEKVLEVGGPPATTKYLFLGDFVDRGCFSVEVILLLYAIKLNYPDTTYLLRGNHECRQMTSFFNFRKECLIKFDLDVYESFMNSFDALPLACIVNGKFIALHGGIGPELRSLEDINSINRFSEPPKQGNLCDMLWADPVDTEDGKTQDRFVQNGVRGCSYFYNYEAVVKFLKRNELLSIIRAHEAQLDGYRMHTWGSTSFPFVITIFSAPNYCDVYNNKGAIIKFKQGNLSIHQLVYTAHPYILPNYMDIFEWSLPFLAEKVMAVLYAMLKERPRDRLSEESHDHIRELQETVHVSKKDALRNKILFIARMMKIFRTLRQEHELILQLKGIYPGHKLPNGLIIEGREAILSAIEQFQRAKEWDSENEKWPDREEAELV